jgi:hypothetical protein
MGFIPDLSPREFGDFTVADAAIDKQAEERGVSPDSPAVQAAKKVLRLVHEFHKGLIMITEGGDPDEVDRALDAAEKKMGELRPDINEVDRLAIASLVSGIAVSVSPTQLAKGQGYGFI